MLISLKERYSKQINILIRDRPLWLNDENNVIPLSEMSDNIYYLVDNNKDVFDYVLNNSTHFIRNTNKWGDGLVVCFNINDEDLTEMRLEIDNKNVKKFLKLIRPDKDYWFEVVE